jgi:hypothetical protein
MFVQVIQGHVSDPSAVKAQLDRWTSELGPGAAGWLGATAGVTDDGTSVAVVRFESEEAARANSDRPEQGAWWEQMAALYDDEPTFQDCTLVDVDTPGDPAQAGFVQVMRGRSSDVHRARELMAADPTDWAAFRPDILGTVWAGSEDGNWTMTIYFTSEADAREGEQKEPPPELAATMEELTSLDAGEIRYLDLRDPWLTSPA